MSQSDLVENAELGSASGADDMRNSVRIRAVEAIRLLTIEPLDLETHMTMIPRHRISRRLRLSLSRTVRQVNRAGRCSFPDCVR
jgi:hypothetical protein